MSHFTVMVAIPGDRIGPDELDVESAITQVLAKYNEQDEDYCIEEWSEFEPRTIPLIADRAREFAGSGNWTKWVDAEVPEYQGQQVQVPKQFTAEELGNDLHMTIAFLAGGDLDYWNRDYRIREDGVVEERRYYNPDAQWDWWVIGGRWRGFFMLKPGVMNARLPMAPWREAQMPKDAQRESVDLLIETPAQEMTALAEKYAFLGEPGTGEWFAMREGKPGENYEAKADAAVKSWIDFERMREEAKAEATLRHNTLTEALGGREHPSWTKIREMHGDDIDGARADYNGREIVKEMREKGLAPFMDDFNDYWCLDAPDPLTAYVDRAMANTISTYAYVDIDGEWKAPGQMGWFGMSSDTEETRASHKSEQAQWIDGLPDDTWLVVVDCHI